MTTKELADEITRAVAAGEIEFVQLFPGDHTEMQALSLGSVSLVDYYEPGRQVVHVALVGSGE
jgi:hypothetical protein